MFSRTSLSNDAPTGTNQNEPRASASGWILRAATAPLRSRLVLFTCSFFILAGQSLSFAQHAEPPQTAALINEQLDKPIDIELQNTPLPEALRIIEDRTGVPVRPDRSVYDILPYGRRTPVSIRASGVSLRAVIVEVSTRLGLSMSVEPEAVGLRPRAILQRLGRRATPTELALIDVLSRTRLKVQGTTLSVDDLIRGIDQGLLDHDQQLQAANQPAAGFVVEFRGPPESRAQSVSIRRNPTLLEVIDVIDAGTPLTAYPWESTVVFLSKKSLIEERLRRPLDLPYLDADIAQVLLDLSNQTNVKFVIEPAALQRVPAAYRTIKLSVNDAPAWQLMEALSGATGLKFDVRDDGVYVSHDGPTNSGGRVVATYSIGDGISILIREDDLPPELLEKIRSKQAEAIEALKRQKTPAH